MLTHFIRAVILYAALVAFTRAMGKRQLGQFQPYEFVMTMLIANLVASPMSDVSTPLLHGILPVAAMFVIHSLITLLSMRSDRMRLFFSGKPSVIISRGVWRQDEMRRLCLTLADALEGLHAAGILDPAEVETAIVEANGSISAFTRAELRPASPADLNIKTDYQGPPVVLVMDGRVQTGSLAAAGLDEAWLRRTLAAHRLSVKDAFICSLDTQGVMTVQDMRCAVSRFQALEPAEVTW
ncbi:MAG: DUF421 domain-containing protein [Clostridia bacterium]|nr:DUF421 domain-containing protein [Clostridia bacterium]MBR4442236.1 DUF421 domain-containing protein [Clostridia bacterium]